MRKNDEIAFLNLVRNCTSRLFCWLTLLAIISGEGIEITVGVTRGEYVQYARELRTAISSVLPHGRVLGRDVARNRE